MGRKNKSKRQKISKVVQSHNFKAKNNKNKADLRKVIQDNKDKILDINKQFEEVSSSLLKKVVKQPTLRLKEDSKSGKIVEEMCRKHQVAEKKEEEVLQNLSGFKF